MRFKDNKAIYLQIADTIADDIARGTLGPDERVPSVRELAAQVEVNVNTVARTFEHLQTQGLIYTKRGLGYFVAADARHKILAHRRDTLLGHELDHLFEQLHAIGVTPDELRQRYHDFCAQKAP